MKQTRRALLASLLVALCVATNYALAGIPNVELMTIVVFVSGYLLGARLGAVIGAAAVTFHSLFNPLGAALPPLLAAQIVGYVIVGVTGGTLGPVLAERKNPWVTSVVAGVVGGTLVLAYQILTNVASFYTFVSEKTVAALFKYLWAGVAFTAIQIVWNTAVFFAVLRPILSVLKRYRTELE